MASYALDEGSGTTATDASGHGLNGTLTNGATWGTGRYGSAVALDGIDDLVNLANPSGLQLTGSMTISGWINSAAFPPDDAAVVSKRGSNGYQLDTTIDTGPRVIGFKLTNSSGANMMRYGATAMQLNAWYHIAGVYNATARTMDRAASSPGSPISASRPTCSASMWRRTPPAVRPWRGSARSFGTVPPAL